MQPARTWVDNMFSLFSDLRMVLIAGGAFIIGAGVGNFRGEWVGHSKGYAKCQSDNRKATNKKNSEIEADKRSGAVSDVEHAERVAKALRDAVATLGDDATCTVLEPGS